MLGFRTYREFIRVHEFANKLGFNFGYPKHGYDQEMITLYPLDQENLPIFSRDASLFTGDLEAVDNFLRGVEWARNYDRMLGLSDDKKRERKEQDHRNRELANTLKK
jgi:hypothetical protein